MIFFYPPLFCELRRRIYHTRLICISHVHPSLLRGFEDQHHHHHDMHTNFFKSSWISLFTQKFFFFTFYQAIWVITKLLKNINVSLKWKSCGRFDALMLAVRMKPIYHRWIIGQLFYQNRRENKTVKNVRCHSFPSLFCATPSFFQQSTKPSHIPRPLLAAE